jgi:hypothetical protein
MLILNSLVLFRSLSPPSGTENWLMKIGVPYQLSGSTPIGEQTQSDFLRMTSPAASGFHGKGRRPYVRGGLPF